MTWIIPTSISRAFAQASGCSKQPSNSAASNSDSAPVLRCAVSGKPTPQPASWPGWKRRAWSQRLFSAAISGTSTAARFVAWWTSSVLACPVSRTPALGSNAALKTSEATGPTTTDQSRTSCESWASVAPPWCSSKTCLPGFEADSFDLSEKSYADWVTRSKARSLSLRRVLARITSGSGFSCWPTPHGLSGQNGPDGNEFSTLVRNWLSPTGKDGETDHDGPATLEALRNGTADDTHHRLRNQVQLWATPAASESQRGTHPYSQAEIDRPQGCPMTLAKDVAMWATPAAHERAHDPREVDHGIQLANQAVTAWPTPNSRDHKGTDLESRNGGASLSHAVQTGEFSHRDQPPTGDPSHNTSGRRLNPAFVCWLMGWPWYWTRVEPMPCGAEVTVLWRQQQRLLLSNLCVDRTF